METDEEKEFEYKFIREFKKLNEMFSEIEKNKKIVEEEIISNYTINKKKVSSIIENYNNFIYGKLLAKFVSCGNLFSIVYGKTISNYNVGTIEEYMGKILELRLIADKEKIRFEYINGSNKLKYICWFGQNDMYTSVLVQDDTNLKMNILNLR